jgi:hypothetical protein
VVDVRGGSLSGKFGRLFTSAASKVLVVLGGGAWPRSGFSTRTRSIQLDCSIHEYSAHPNQQAASVRQPVTSCDSRSSTTRPKEAVFIKFNP